MHGLCSWLVSGTAGASLEGAQKRKPTARSLLAAGWKLFLALLGVSPRAGSGNSLLSRSRNNRHGRLGRNSLGGGSHHCDRKNSMRADRSEGKSLGNSGGNPSW